MKALPIAATALLLTAAAKPIVYTLPEETSPALPPGPEAELVATHCSACHSLDYIRTQPRGKGASFWRDSVTKMVAVYGAPIGDKDAARIAAYLGRVYGAAP